MEEASVVIPLGTTIVAMIAAAINNKNNRLTVNFIKVVPFLPFR